MEVKEALQIVLDIPSILGFERVFWKDAIGKVLAEDIIADHDFPPFNRVMMDGFAFRFEDWQKGQRHFKIGGMLSAGENPQDQYNSDCIEIMTGAMMPDNYNVVVPFERVSVENGICILHDDVEVKNRHHVHEQGKDYKKNEVLVSRGTRITALNLPVISSCGYEHMEAIKLPSIAVISTGDELVEINKQPLPFQIRMSNGPGLMALLKPWSTSCELFHWKDDLDAMHQSFEQLQDFDILIFSGGVSMGKKDFMPELWRHKGFETLFHRVNQKPGKPLFFGRNENQILFGLPGNPVSAMSCAMVYVLSMVKNWLGISHSEKIELDGKIPEHEKLDLFAPIHRDDGSMRCIDYNGSGDLVSFGNACGVVWIPKKSQEENLKQPLTYFPAL